LSETHATDPSEYIRELFAREDDLLRSIGRRAERAGLPSIAVNAEVGRLLQLVTVAVRARRALEIGTLAGYSAVWIARGLPPGGRLVTLEHDPEHAAVARETFEAAAVSDRVEVRVGEALELLAALPGAEPFDVAFLDAAKEEYPAYLELVLPRLRPGGALLADNALLRGRVIEPDGSEEARAMRDFNERVANDPRLVSTLIPVRDGVLVSILREGA